MKTSTLLKSSVLALFLGTSTLMISGCAGTSTKESTGEYIDNSAITARVKSAFASDDIVKGRDITVESYRGTVQLSGFVNTSAEKDRAGTIAAGVQGVQHVKNNLVVKS